MSEYQYYEFRAIDRPLTPKEKDELRAISTRAEITSTSFTNTYNYGDFKGNPGKLMDRYFDAFVYVANWGTHSFMVRIPRRFLDVTVASAYCGGETLSLEAGEDHVVLEFSSDDESGGEWDEGDRWMSALISIRAELIRGDTRALYLGWLASLAAGFWDKESDELEPHVPPGLAKLSSSLQELASFLRIDDELIEVAASASSDKIPAKASRADLAGWIKKLPSLEKDAYLLRLLEEEGDLLLRAELTRRFEAATFSRESPSSVQPGRRTVGQILAARDALLEAKQRKATEKAAQERARLEAEKTRARAAYLDELALREPKVWLEIGKLIAMKRPKDYDQATILLLDLKDLAGRTGRPQEFEARVRDLREIHRNKPSFIQRLKTKNLF